jgi:methylated-DNA-[protein]-cysteine S-methyltransferase
VLARLTEQLGEYFRGERKRFEVALAPSGTPFQRRVWDALLRIPYAHTTSYGALAQSIAMDNSVRAVGAAIGRNPISVLIPCHRVLGANGSLTGYAGGLPRKQSLLALERADVQHGAAGQGAQLPLALPLGSASALA